MPRVIRFDFHWTTEGWRISEANSDVPGGFTEASDFARLVCAHFPDTTPAGDPARAWIEAIGRVVPAGGNVTLISAVGYMEDQQVNSYLASRLAAVGIAARAARPADLMWTDGIASFGGLPIDAIIRFYQGEWLPLLPPRSQWQNLIVGRTAVMNPVRALLTESKRFPLTWDALGACVPTWRLLLPETREAGVIDCEGCHDWLLKQAFCNTGDAVLSPDLMPAAQWRKAMREARRDRYGWVAQRRFTPVPAQTPLGNLFPCVGVYVIDGKAVGIYGRISNRAIVDYSAIDIAVLIEPQAGA